MNIQVNRRSGMIILYLFLTMYIANLIYEASNFSDPRARLFPLIFGIPTVILLFSLLLIQIIPLLPSDISYETNLSDGGFYNFNDGDRGNISKLVISVFLSFPFIAYLFGFLITVPLYTAAFTLATTKNTKNSIVVSIIVAFAWYAFFVLGLNVVFYEGIITNMVF